MVLSPPQEGGGLEPALEWLNRGVGVKGLQVALVVFQIAHPHPNLPPVRGKELVVASMQCKVIEGCQIPLITLRYIKAALLLQGKAAFIPSP